jgi:hypothetical protein
MNNFGTGTSTNDFLDEAPNIDDILREFKEESGDLDWVDAYTSFDDETEGEAMDDESSNLLARLREISEGKVEEPIMPAEIAPTIPQPTPSAPVAAVPAAPPVQKTTAKPQVAPTTHTQAGRTMQTPFNQTSGYNYDTGNTVNFSALINNPAAQTWVNFANELKNLSLEVMTAGASGAISPEVARSTMSTLIDAVGEANKATPNVKQVTNTIHQLMLMTMGQIPLINMCSDVNLAACLIPMLK